jgi:GAF domain-containing protein
MTAPDTRQEAERLAALRSYEILDTPPNGAFDRITALAAHHFDAPVALLSLVDEDRIWFKSRHGLEAEQIPRSPGLCASVVMSGDRTYVVENALKDPRSMPIRWWRGKWGSASTQPLRC